MEIHDQDSCIPISAIFCGYLDDEIQAGVPIDQVVFYEKTGLLESGKYGVIYNLQIAVSQIDVKPKSNDIIEIGDDKYRFDTVRLMNNNVDFEPFYQCTIKGIRS